VVPDRAELEVRAELGEVLDWIAASSAAAAIAPSWSPEVELDQELEVAAPEIAGDVRGAYYGWFTTAGSERSARGGHP
jgi:hypothetical protein